MMMIMMIMIITIPYFELDILDLIILLLLYQCWFSRKFLCKNTISKNSVV